jgi:hypothetical protein
VLSNPVKNGAPQLIQAEPDLDNAYGKNPDIGFYVLSLSCPLPMFDKGKLQRGLA